MNEQARNNIHNTKEALRIARQNLEQAVDQVENGSMRNEVRNELNQVTSCFDECDRIAAGLSQYRNEKNYDGTHD